MFGIDSARKRAYKSVCVTLAGVRQIQGLDLTVREPGISFVASFLANKRSSLIAISTWVFEDTGLSASAHKFTTYRSRGCHMPILGELGGTLRTPPSVMGTTIALNHSFQKHVMDGSRPRMPYDRGIQRPVSPSVSPSILDAAPCLTGRRRSVIKPIFSSTALISSSRFSRARDPEATDGNAARSRDNFTLSMASLSPRLLANSRSSSVILPRLHSSHFRSNSAEARSFSGIHTMMQIPYSRELSPDVIANPCQVDRGRSSADTMFTSLGNANIGT